MKTIQLRKYENQKISLYDIRYELNKRFKHKEDFEEREFIYAEEVAYYLGAVLKVNAENYVFDFVEGATLQYAI